MLSHLFTSSNLNPGPCSVACADLPLCSLPSSRRSCSFRSKTQSSAPSFPFPLPSNAHQPSRRPLCPPSALCLPNDVRTGPATQFLHSLAMGFFAPCPIALDAPPVPHGAILLLLESETWMPGGLVQPGQVAAGTRGHGATSQSRKFCLAQVPILIWLLP